MVALEVLRSLSKTSLNDGPYQTSRLAATIGNRSTLKKIPRRSILTADVRFYYKELEDIYFDRP